MRARKMGWVSVLALGSLAACAPVEGKESIDETWEIDREDLAADADDLAADSALRPLDHGALSFGALHAAQIGPQRYHAWQFTLTDDASVGVFTGPSTEGGPAVDTVLALYRRGSDGRWGRALFRNDDDGASLWSRVEAELGAGEYRALVRGYSSRTTGPFAISGTCVGPGCPRVAPEPVTGCHPAIADAIRACHAGWLADADFDPSTTTPEELMRQCADVEVVASAWDSLCLGAGAPADVCGADLEAFGQGHLVLCRNELVDEVLDGSCVFGRGYRDAFGSEGPLVVRAARVLEAGATLSPTEISQIVRAVRETAYSDVTTLEEAFAAVDEGRVNQTFLWDASARRSFVAIEVGAGDNSFGAYFPVDSAEPVARIVDGDVVDCRATWGAERRRCSASEPCRAGLGCEGVEPTTGFGRCLAAGLASDPVEGASCGDDLECGSALICQGSALGGEGLCGPAWMRGRFSSAPNAPIPDASTAGVTASVPVYGLATVSTDVRLDLMITHPRISDLTVTLVNPSGTESVVFRGERDGSELVLDHVAVAGFPGDEGVQGMWTVRVVDSRRRSTGTLHRFGLEITSRWD